MDYLVDTNVISEIAKQRPDPKVVSFLRDKSFSISSIVFDELAYGTYRLDHQNKNRARYIEFIESIKTSYEDCIMPVSTKIAELSGRLRAAEGQRGRTLSIVDALIAATAMHGGMILVTRNTKDFAQLAIPLLNPFANE